MDSKIRKTGDVVQGLICAYSTVHNTINQLSTVTCTTKRPGHYRVAILRACCVQSQQVH